MMSYNPECRRVWQNLYQKNAVLVPQRNQRNQFISTVNELVCCQPDNLCCDELLRLKMSRLPHHVQYSIYSSSVTRIWYM